MHEMKNYFLIIILLSGCSKIPADYEDVTNRYKLPPELENHKIFVLGGGFSNTNPLWVIVPPTKLEKATIIQQNHVY